MKVYVILQREYANRVGLKGTGAPNDKWAHVYGTKEDAQEYLKNIIAFVKTEIKLGKRQKDNLDPIKGLDWAICEAELNIDMTRPKEKGWK